MHSLLIVDDDEIIREGIEKNIDWAAHDIRIVGQANNGLECLEMIKVCLPGVILSDIRMPFLDGLQLTELVAKLYPQIKVVLLSAYDDFQYAKKALDLKVQQYIMKYDENEDILKAVIKAFEEHDLQKNNLEIVRQSRELLKKQYLCGLLSGENARPENQANSCLVDFSFEHDAFCAAVAELNAADSQGGSENPLQRELTLDNIRVFCEAILAQEQFQTYNVILNHRIVFLFNPEEASDKTLEHIEALLEDAVKQVGFDLQQRITFGVGNIYQGMDHISRTYSEAAQVLELKDYRMTDRQKSSVIQINTIHNYGNSHYQIMEQVIGYIQSNYQQTDLSLNHIADAVHVSAAYISMLFKKYKGVNLTEYITDIRVKKAAELLAGTNMKTYEISEKVGYPNSQYFSVIFKKSTGFSPTDYRRQHQTTAGRF